MLSFLRKYKKGCILLCIMLFICGSTAFAEYDKVIDEITNSRKESIYNLELNAPFSKDSSGVREVIDPETGSLSASINLFALNGRGGIESCSISLTYSTAYATLNEETVKNTDGKYINTILNKRGDIDMFKGNMGMMLGALMGVAMLGVGVAMLSNTKAARRRRMIKRAVKTVNNVGSAMQKMTAF